MSTAAKVISVMMPAIWEPLEESSILNRTKA